MMYNYWNGSAALSIPGLLAGWLSLFDSHSPLESFLDGLGSLESSKNDSKVWFIVLLLVHTVGILDIIYIFLTSEKSGKKLLK